MIQHTAIIPLIASSAISCLMFLFAGWKSFLIIRRWDIRSGSELQLQLERATYLISTIIGFVLFFQIISLFLYIATVDHLHNLLAGAMCAAGSLNANGFGYPVLILKTVTCLFGGVWLVINHVDARGYDYPLIRPKYVLLLALAPLVSAETVLQFLYFSNLDAQVITSCCGSLFNAGTGTLASGLAGLPRVPMEVALTAAIGVICLIGLRFRITGKGGYLFAVASTLAFVVAIASMISFVSLYVYELPTHHCPFCILHKEYSYVGYPLYAALLGGGISGISVGTLMPASNIPSLAKVLPGILHKLTTITILLYLAFGLAVTLLVLHSALKF